MIKALFFDIDGTLVSFKTHRVPESACNAIRAARERGIKVFIATGRPYSFVRSLEGIEYDGVICTNGACFVDGNGEVVFKHCISKEDIKRLVDNQRTHPIACGIADHERAFMCGMEYNRETVNIVFTLLDIPLPVEAPIETALDMDVLQIVAFFTEAEEPLIMGEVLRGCTSTRWHETFADCIVTGTNKATGIDEVIKMYGIDISETAAFGDGGNDIEMLEHVGIGVAMGNATDDVKKHAKMVTTSVDDDGIANALKQIL